MTTTLRTNIVELVSEATIKACVVRNINGEIWNIMFHSVQNNGFEGLEVVLDAGFKFYIGDAASATIPGELAFQINLLEDTDVLPYGDMHGVCEEIMV